MEFDEHDDPDEDMEIPAGPPGYDTSSARAPPKAESEPAGGARKSGGGGGGGGGGFRYRECQKNHAVGIGGHAVDGCCEFMAAGEEGSLDAFKCAACNCHRNFHRREPLSPSAAAAAAAANYHLFHHHHHHQPFPSSGAASAPAAAAYYRSPPTPSGYLHVRPPLALPGRDQDAEDHVSNPSSSGGGGGGGGSSSKKRFRTKFTQEQKEKMLEFAERVGWRIQKHDEAAVEQFCADTGVRRQVLKVWMHNNKHTLGKKP